MNLTDLISNIHWLPVIVMTILSFALGALWHSKILFGKTWEKEINPSGTQRKFNIPLIFGGTAVVHFIALAALSAVVSGAGAGNGLLAGFFISIVWIVPAMTGTYLFATRSLKLLAIDAGMYVVLFSVAGLIMGVW
ncbi:MAG TPA: DUF1761 domain-containing protein [Bacteroidales bacterium]